VDKARGLTLVLIAALLGACSTGGTNGTQTGGPITVLAASSLQAALTAALDRIGVVAELGFLREGLAENP